jgi:polyphenol oxidase
MSLTSDLGVQPGWMVPDWPVPPGVRAVCSARWGGFSAAPFDTLNLGDHVGDDPASVARNRERFASVLGAQPVFLTQVHGADVMRLGQHPTPPHGSVADAAYSRDAGLACTVMVADCLPVLFASRDGRQVAAAHAGWRGLAGGVLEATLQSFTPLSAVFASLFAIEKSSHFEPNLTNSGADVLAWLGPCIGPTAFEVGADVLDAFVRDALVQAWPGTALSDRGSVESAVHACFAPQSGGKYLADLAGLARIRLRCLGVTAVYGNDSTPAWCTVGNPSRFFSHRRDGGRRLDGGVGGTGRFAVSIWRVGV